jgi:hypothetical protein
MYYEIIVVIVCLIKSYVQKYFDREEKLITIIETVIL